MLKFRNAFRSPNARRVPWVPREGEVDKTVQSGKDDADIRVIVKRWRKTGELPVVSRRVPLSGDFTEVSDFRTAVHAVMQAEAAFAGLSADVRKRFGNDPQNYLEFCSDPKNIPEMKKMGLAVPDPVVVESPPTRVVVVSESGDGEERSGGSADSGAKASSGRGGAAGKR